MSEIINVHLGESGIRLGLQFWRRLADEHGLDQIGEAKNSNEHPNLNIKSYYNQTSAELYSPRAVFIDLDPNIQNIIRSDQLNVQFRPENCLFGKCSTGNSWPKGMYEYGSELIDEALSIIRKQAENSDCLQGVQLFHSLGGGTGSGLSSLLSSHLKDEYPNELLTSFSIFPSPQVSDSVLEPYNAILTMNTLIESMDSVTVIDNGALYEICRKNLKLYNVTYEDLNYLASMAMSGATCFYRFPVEGVNGFSKLVSNLIPEPRLHFLSLGLAPLVSKDSPNCDSLSITCLLDQAQSSSNSFCFYDPLVRRGTDRPAVAVFRGKFKSEDMYKDIGNDWGSSFESFSWNSDYFKNSVCEIPLKEASKSCTIISNTSAITDIFERLSAQVSMMFERRMFLFSFSRGGFDELEIPEAEYNCNELILEYKNFFSDIVELDND